MSVVGRIQYQFAGVEPLTVDVPHQLKRHSPRRAKPAFHTYPATKDQHPAQSGFK